MVFDNDVNDLFGFLTEEPASPEWRFIEGERRDVAVLFADVNGFTDMSRNLDPEIVHLKMDELLKLFTKCTHYYGGFVDKYIGDSIMSLFGAKKASEQDTERSILTGLKMIQQLKLFNALLRTQPLFKDIQLSVRIGINTGLVSVGKVGDSREGDFTVYGDTVNLASRMESNAPENKIMVSRQTKQTVDKIFDFERVGLKELKGYDEPVECFVVIAPKQERGQRWSQQKTPYIGRRNEIALLQEVISSALSQAKHHPDTPIEHVNISITGDAGMGKSRLLFETMYSQSSNFTYLYAVASATNPAPLNLFTNLLENYFQAHTYQPLESKKQLLERGIDALCKEMAAGLADADQIQGLRDAVPLLGYLLEIPSPDHRLKQKGKDLLIHIQQALHAFIQSVASVTADKQKPLVLSWDDLHWADEATLIVLDFLYQSSLLGTQESIDIVSSNPILSFMLYRDWDSPVTKFSGVKFTHKLALSPLQDAEIVQLIKQQAGNAELPPSTIEKVRELSAGNPFYLEEWCNYIYDLPKLDVQDLPVPTNLHALILSRLDRLSDAVRLLLQKASVIGQEFFVELLREIERRLQNPVDPDQTLAELENQALILRMLGFDYSSYFFKHITTREVAYQTLLQINRKMLHQLTAEAIESIFPEQLDEFLYALAEHYQRAEITDKAIFYLQKAASAAAKSYSNKQAIGYYDHLLRIIQESEYAQIADILLKKAEISWLIGMYDESDELIDRAMILADESANTDLCFEASRQRGAHSFFREEMSKALQDWENCLALAGIPEKVGSGESIPFTSSKRVTQLAIAHGNLGVWYQHHKDYAQAIEHHQQSLSFSEQTGDYWRKSKTLGNMGLIYLNQKDYIAAENHFQSYLDISASQRYLKEHSIALGNLGFLFYKQGDFDKAMQFYEQKWIIVDKIGDNPEMIKVQGNIANIHRDLGQHREALEYYQKTLSFKESIGNKKELAITHNAIAKELQELNRLDEAGIAIEKAIDYATDYPGNLCEYLYNQADILFNQDKLENAAKANLSALKLAQHVNRQSVVDACNRLDERINHTSTISITDFIK